MILLFTHYPNTATGLTPPVFPLPMLGTNLHRCNSILFSSFAFSFFCFYFHSFYFYNIAFRNDTAFSSQYVDLRFHGVARRHVPFCSSTHATIVNTSFALQDPRIICILVFWYFASSSIHDQGKVALVLIV